MGPADLLSRGMHQRAQGANSSPRWKERLPAWPLPPRDRAGEEVLAALLGAASTTFQHCFLPFSLQVELTAVSSGGSSAQDASGKVEEKIGPKLEEQPPDPNPNPECVGKTVKDEDRKSVV